MFDSPDENELLVSSVLSAIEETTSNLLRNQVALNQHLPLLCCIVSKYFSRLGQIAKRVLVENLDLLLLTIDEIVDDGLIVETDSGLITDRVSMRGKDSVLAYILYFAR